MMMRVGEVMSKRVVTAMPSTPLIEIARCMLENGIGAIPIVEADRVVGIVARSDVLPFQDDPDRSLRTASDVMSKDVMSVHETMPVTLAARALFHRGIKRAPVL